MRALLIFLFFFGSDSFVATTHFVHRRTSPPLCLAKYLRRHVIDATASGGGTCNCNCGWEPLDPMIAPRIMKKCFDVKMKPAQLCEIFTIEGIPAASMVYTKRNKWSSPDVEAFYLNKGFVLLYDGGDHMRRKLFARYPRLGIQHAENRNDFLHF